MMCMDTNEVAGAKGITPVSAQGSQTRSSIVLWLDHYGYDSERSKGSSIAVQPGLTVSIQNCLVVV